MLACERLQDAQRPAHLNAVTQQTALLQQRRELRLKRLKIAIGRAQVVQRQHTLTRHQGWAIWDLHHYSYST